MNILANILTFIPFRISIPLSILLSTIAMNLFVVEYYVARGIEEVEITTKDFVERKMTDMQRVIEHFLHLGESDGIQNEISATAFDKLLKSCLLFDENNNVMASTRLSDVGKTLSDVKLQDNPDNNSLKEKINLIREKMNGMIYFHDDRNTIVGAYPIILHSKESELRPTTAGVLFYEYDLFSVKQEKRRWIYEQSRAYTKFFLLFALFIWFFFQLAFGRRVKILILAAERFANQEKDLKTKLSGGDELATLSKAFDNMMDENQKYKENILNLNKSLEARVKERTHELEETNKQLVEANRRAEAANIAKREFLANMSHELRTPLNAIMGFSQVMKEEEVKPLLWREYLTSIYSAGEQLLELINGLLDISKIESGKHELLIEYFDLPQLIKSVEETIKINTISKNILLTHDITPEIPQYIKSDKRKLRQILINIVGNAAKFTETGKIEVRVKLSDAKGTFSANNLRRVTSFEKYIYFEVEDTGMGIKLEDFDFIFNPFTQSDAGKNSMKGTGLGLSISKKFVELLGGEINVQSEVGKGSLFSFYILASN